MPVSARPIADRFWPKVKIGAADECWPWTGHLMPKGYGQFNLGAAEGYRLETAHRVAWRLVRGPIPPGMFVCHQCDNPRCCNPAHLFLGTPLDNQRDMVAKGRSNKGVKNPNAILTAEDVRFIRQEVAAGATRAEVAKRYPVSLSAIFAAANRSNWKWVE